MPRLSFVDLKAFLVRLVCYPKIKSRTKHHLVALHVVIETVFKSWLKRFQVDQINVDNLIGGNLDPVIAFYEKDEASKFESVVELPAFFASFLGSLLFEKEDATGASYNKAFALNHYHLTQI